jgi:hypothetical protein
MGGDRECTDRDEPGMGKDIPHEWSITTGDEQIQGHPRQQECHGVLDDSKHELIRLILSAPSEALL